jgi:1L-myo-inositol 1-phosphate cytidylyltransferase / CDP-L-myo-inositol myo-inositolphosphotransferase
MTDKPISKGVVLAAGDGDRLGEITSTIPKVLLLVLGKPLILYPIEALIRAGIRQIAVVIGYLGDKVEAFFYSNPISEVSVQFIFNPYHQCGNATSVEVAGDWVVGEPFLLCMGDHIMRQDYVLRFLNRSPCQETLAVDFRPGNHHILEEATKVRVDGKRHISDIGKELTQWDGIDTGVFLLTENFLSAARELRANRGPGIEISEVIRFMLSKGRDFVTCDTTGPFWADIDTTENMQLVEGTERWL